VFHRAAEKHQVRSAEAVVGVARQDWVAVKVRAASGWVEVKRDNVARTRSGAGQEKPEADRALVVNGGGDAGAAGSGVRGTRIGAIVGVGSREMDLPCQGKLMTDIRGPALEIVGRAT